MKTKARKVAIVTGGGRGIGKAIAERIAQDGTSVVVNYSRSAEEAKSLVAEIEAEGGKALAVKADMSKIADVHRLFKETLDYFGRLDILINNAAIARPALLSDLSEEDFDKHFMLNVKGPLFAMQEAAQCINNGGRIVNLTSEATVLSPAGMSVYSGTKGAVEQFTQVVAKELGNRNITVNAVMPGATVTDGFTTLVTPEMQVELKNNTPLGRLGEPKDIADVIAFIISEEARWLTGQIIRATGGLV